MLIRYGYKIEITCPQPTPLVCMLLAETARLPDLVGPEDFSTNPSGVPVSTYTDIYGNRCMRMTAPYGDFSIRGDATMNDSGLPDPVYPNAREVPVAYLPDECLLYLMGSRYCETDRLSQVAWDLFGNLAPGWSRVQAVCDYVHGHIRFDYLQASATRSAYDVWQGRIGVCRDFAHLFVAFCRCLNIPARYVNGHLGDIGIPVTGPMDFSAWTEVWLDGAWHTFDPRNNARRIGRIVIARGRDAADVPMINSFGPHMLKSFEVWTDPVDG